MSSEKITKDTLKVAVGERVSVHVNLSKKHALIIVAIATLVTSRNSPHLQELIATILNLWPK
jgi:hypothetical protein